jgi:hypothetical protein
VLRGASGGLTPRNQRTVSRQGLVAWTRAFGLGRLKEGLSADVQRAWERDFIAATAPLRQSGFVRLGGVTRVVVAAAAR